LRNSLWQLATLLVPASLAGCYTYVPAELATLPPGQQVRVYLTRAAVASLPEDVAPTDLSTLYVSGMLMAQQADSLTVSIPVGTRNPGFISGNIRQLVKVRTAEVVDLQRRQFSVLRTALVAGAGVGVGAAVITLIFQSQSSIDISDPNEDTSRVPILAFPLRMPVFGW